MSSRAVWLNDQLFHLELMSNQTTEALLQQLPLSVSMSDLHDNEKYGYLPQTLPAAPEKVGRINKGDVMLYGEDCLVIFYQSFDTSYTYTPIGSIREADELAVLETQASVHLRID